MSQSLGDHLRRVRKHKGIGLREAAAKVGISPTYLSRVERQEELNPPAERVLKALAELLDESADTLIALAGRVPDEVKEHVRADPGLPAFLRAAREQNLSSDELMRRLLDPNKKGGR